MKIENMLENGDSYSVVMSIGANNESTLEISTPSGVSLNKDEVGELIRVLNFMKGEMG